MLKLQPILPLGLYIGLIFQMWRKAFLGRNTHDFPRLKIPLTSIFLMAAVSDDSKHLAWVAAQLAPCKIGVTVPSFLCLEAPKCVETADE